MKIRISPDASLVFRIDESELGSLREGKRLSLKLPLPGAFETTYELEASNPKGATLELNLDWERRAVRISVSSSALDHLATLEGRREGVFSELGSGSSMLRYGVEIDLKPKRSAKAGD